MLVSIIMPTYNRSKFIGKAISSVFNQHYQNWELIVVDDGSTDDTATILELYAKDTRIRYFRQKRSGATRARNFGLRKSVGQLVLFLDSDDEILPLKLERHVTLFNEQKSLDVTVSEVLRYNYESGREELIRNIMPKRDLSVEFVGKKIKWCIHGPIWSKNFLLREKGFDVNLTSSQDFEFYARLALAQPRVGYIFEALSVVNDYESHKDKVKIRNNRDPLCALKNHLISRVIVWKALGRSDLGFSTKLKINAHLIYHLMSCLKKANRESLGTLFSILHWYLTRAVKHKLVIE